MQVASKIPDSTPAGSIRPRHTLEFVAVAVGMLFLLPFAYLTWRTVSRSSGLGELITSSATLAPLGRSLLIATVTALACGVVGSTLAWMVARTDLPGRRIFRWVLPLPLVIPSFVGATAMLSAFGRGALVEWIPQIDGFAGAFIVLTLVSYPYVYLPVVARLRSTAPQLEEASRLLGAGTAHTIRDVVLPQIRGTALSGMLLVFLYVLSDFGAVALMRYDTITRAIFSSRLADRTTSLSLGFVLAVIALGVAWSERKVAARVAPVREGGKRQIRYALGRWRALAFGWTAAVVSMALVAPIAVFAVWVVRGSSTIGLGYSGLGDSLGFLVRPTVNSAISAVIAAVVAAVIVLPVAYLAARGSGWPASFASTAVASVFALPGLVLALAIVFWAINAPAAVAGLYQTLPLLLLAYVLHFGAQSMTVTRSAVASLPARFEEAAQMLGASRMRRFVTIEMPIIAPSLVAGAGLVLLSTLKELPATLLLAPVGFQTLATKIWGAAEEGFFAEVGVTSLVLILLSGLLTWTFILRHQP